MNTRLLQLLLFGACFALAGCDRKVDADGEAAASSDEQAEEQAEDEARASDDEQAALQNAGEGDSAGEQPASQATGNAATSLEVLNTGTGEKRQLRYNLAAMEPATVQMQIRNSTSMDMGPLGSQEMELPALTLVLNFTDTAMVDDKLRVSFEMVSMRYETEGATGVAASMATMMNAQLGEFAYSGAFTMDDRGRVTDEDFDITGSAAMEDVMGQVENAMSQLSVPLPEEAVGVGAEWLVSQSFGDVLPFDIDQRATMTVASLSDDAAVLEFEVEQEMRDQVFEDPEGNGSVTIETLETEGEGTTNLRLNHLISTSTFDLQLSMTMRPMGDANAAGFDGPISTEVEMSMEVSEVQ